MPFCACDQWHVLTGQMVRLRAQQVRVGQQLRFVAHIFKTNFTDIINLKILLVFKHTKCVSRSSEIHFGGMDGSTGAILSS